MYSTTPGPTTSGYSPPSLAPLNGTSYSYNVINGQVYYGIPLSGLVASIGTTPASYTDSTGAVMSVFPVTFVTPTAGAAESGKAFSVMTYSGTYKTVNDSSSPVNGSTTPSLTTLSGVVVSTAYNVATGAVSSTTTNSETYIADTDPLTGMFDFENGKAPNASGDLVYTILYGGGMSLRTSISASSRVVSGSGVVLYQQ